MSLASLRLRPTPFSVSSLPLSAMFSKCCLFLAAFVLVLVSSSPTPSTLSPAVAATSDRIDATRREISLRYPQFLNQKKAATATVTSLSALRNDSSLTRIATRTAFFDSFCVHALQRGFTQFVVLGSGLCSRFSTRIPNTTTTTCSNATTSICVWEVDSAEVISAANERSPPPPHIMRVPHTLPPLPDASALPGFDLEKPTVFILEGVLYYLNEEDVRAVVAACSRMARRSCCVASLVSDRRSQGQRKDREGSLAALFKSGTGADV